MFRVIHEILKLPELEYLYNELGKEDDSGTQVYKKMVWNAYREREIPAYSLIMMQVPPLVDDYIKFILANSSKQNFNKHLSWMLEKLGIEPGTISECLLVDIIRYILVCTEASNVGHQAEKVQRWYLLGWILKYLKSDVFKMLAKQALFIDWLFYRGENGVYKIFEPVWLLIINSAAKYKEITEELLEYLFLVARDFDSNDSEIESNVMRVFNLLKNRGSTALEAILYSHYITAQLKYKIESFIQGQAELEQGPDKPQPQSKAEITAGLTSTPTDFTDLEIESLEGSAKKNPADGESKIDKYLADNLYYNSEHHQGKSSIVERENSTRVAARQQILERMGDSIPIFIRELPGFQSFGKEPSFGNLSYLLKEIFDLACSMSNKAYSPVMLDQLSQDQVLKETSEFVIGLFGESLNSELLSAVDPNISSGSSSSGALKGTRIEKVSDILKRVFDMNLDVINASGSAGEDEEVQINSLRIYLFLYLYKLYSENLNHYNMIEKLIALLIDKIPLLFFEFVLFLHAMNNSASEENNRQANLLQQVFQGMYFDKMSELFNRCCASTDNFKDILTATLKFMYINLPSEVMLTIVQTMLLVLTKSKGDHFRTIILFIVRTFNPKIGFELELGQTFKNISQTYKVHLNALIQEILKPGAGSLQFNFWPVHKIITQEDEETTFEATITALRDTINSLPNLKKRKREIGPFLWSFKEYFELKFLYLTDERVMENSLGSIVSLNSDLADFVYLVFKNISDKVIQRSLRRYMKQITENQDAILNLCSHLIFWKEKNFTKTGTDPDKFSLDFLILKQLDEAFEQLEMDKSTLQKLT